VKAVRCWITLQVVLAVACAQLRDLPDDWQHEIPNVERLLEEEQDDDAQLGKCCGPECGKASPAGEEAEAQCRQAKAQRSEA
jgi:hypothetical protein